MNDPHADSATDPLAVDRRSIRRPRVLLVDEGAGGSPSDYGQALRVGAVSEIIVVASSADAIERLSRVSAIECVVCTVRYPDLDGLEVLRTSKIMRPRTPVLLIAAGADPHIPGMAMREGADDFLVEPLEPAELCIRVAALIEKGRKAREAEAQTVLAIGAHPDDVEIGIGGTLIRHVTNGNRVIELVMTDGESGGEKGVRIAEAERAARLVGATLLRGQLPDGFLSDARETVAVIASAVETYVPSVIYVHTRHDVHQDHRATYDATMSAARTVPTIYCYQSPSSTVTFCPTRFVDIGDYLDLKMELINLYRSQTTTRLYLAEDMIRATARYWGRYAVRRFVEPLEIIRLQAP
jgi:LmbE family N-acetylglucosaminyl deacetylase/AmiR/NasT family two-component response regulator